VDGTITPIFAGGWGLKPDWSPVPLADGHERIAFLQAEDIYVMKLDGSDIHRLTTGLEVEQLIWSRDGSQILGAVRDWHLEPDGSHLELFDITCDGSTTLPACRVTGSTPLDLSGSGISPYDFFGSLDWAHGSDRVLVQYLQAGFGLRELGILDLGGAPTFTFLTDNPGGQAYNGAWSWDDSEVVYVKFPTGKKPKAAIVIRDIGTGEETEVFDGDASFGMDWRPTPPVN
jgi:Tol biopolymer transport system component